MTDDQQADEQVGEQAPAPMNREQRRRQKFRRAQNAPQDNLRPQSENNTAFVAPLSADADLDEGPKDALTASNTQGETKLTGPGTGGATESGERITHHEGVHMGNPTKG